MLDATEWVLGALVLVLGGAAFALGGQVIRDAWRSGFKAAPGKSEGYGAFRGEPVTAIDDAPDDRPQGGRNGTRP